VCNYDILENFWPASKHGAIIVTTRDTAMRVPLLANSLFVEPFDEKVGANFLLTMALRESYNKDDECVARQLSCELGGLPLALSQMAAIINVRHWTFPEFRAIYAQQEHHLHKQKEMGWKHLGYTHTIDTVWEHAFENLGNDARACLEVMSFFDNDIIFLDLFKNVNRDELPENLHFCKDELRHVLYPLTVLRANQIQSQRCSQRTNPSWPRGSRSQGHWNQSLSSEKIPG
jgi:hypothetical protein